MARYTGAVCRLCRRERMKLFLKGAEVRHDEVPDRAQARTRRVSTAAVASARASTCSSCARSRRRAASTACSRSSSATSTPRPTGQTGITGENLLRMLEQRLDNVVFRAGFAASRNQARQFVRHGHVHVNGKRVTIPSYQVRKGDVVEIGAQGAEDDRRCATTSTRIDRAVPMWLEVTAADYKATVRDLPLREQIDVPVREQLIVELYSK